MNETKETLKSKRRFDAFAREHVYPEKDVKKYLKILKKEWKAKCKRMEVMSGQVADYELKMLIQDIIGEFKK